MFEVAQYQRSLQKNAFAIRDNGGAQKKYTIMMPPPNVTGLLHMGHALTFTLQDILIRYHQMKGDATLWQAGTDHAGIATQMVVERNLEKQGITRQQLGRDEFINRVWQWKEQSGNTIVSQLQRLGASADWRRQRFTMDDGLSAAVRKVFVDMYKDGLIYRDKRLVNWDVQLQTAVSDLEAVATEVQGAYYHITYPLANGAGGVTVATTRPETLFGDVAVAIHPQSPTLSGLIGSVVKLPLTDRQIPIIADEYADPEKGTGAVKITPAHDFNDFEVGRRHNLPLINILNKDGTLNDNVPAPFAGMDRLLARKMVVSALEQGGFLSHIQPVTHTVPLGDRSNTVIEPLLTEQWYVRADILAKPALQAVQDNCINFVPKNWVNTYNSWLNDIKPWCISRQLWWGHRIPVWYDDDGTEYVAMTEDEAQKAAGNKKIYQDPDVLDTWFSSGLWPFSTLGWPENTPELVDHYPTSVLVTGFDIIFFWVARMIMMGLYVNAKPLDFFDDLMAGNAIDKEKLEKAIPFKDVYIHALVRDKNGQKMSKSKGNVIDPLELIDTFGADALRFTLAIMAAQGRDVKLDTSRIDGYRNFATKLWNATRFGDMNGCCLVDGFNPSTVKLSPNKWMIKKLADCINGVQAALDNYDFDVAATLIYQLLWNDFCDIYVELAKKIFFTTEIHSPDEIDETKATFAFCLQQILLILHPFMPFITDEITQKQGFSVDPLILQKWPNWQEGITFVEPSDISNLLCLSDAARSAKVLLGFAPSEVASLYPNGRDDTLQFILDVNEYNKAYVMALARCKLMDIGAFSDSQKLIPISIFGCSIGIDNTVDLVPLKLKLQKKLSEYTAELQSISQRLSSSDFLAKAGDDVVNKNQMRSSELELTIEEIKKLLGKLDKIT